MSEQTKTRVVHCKREPFTVYIGRPSEWGNPFSHKTGTLAKFSVGTIAEAIEEFERDLKEKIAADPVGMWTKLAALEGEVLGCWCAPGPCHGDVLARYAERAEEEIEWARERRGW